MKNAPCKDCKHRHRACHDQCKAYQEWISAERKKKEEAQNSLKSIADDVHINNIYRVKTRWNRYHG